MKMKLELINSKMETELTFYDTKTFFTANFHFQLLYYNVNYVVLPSVGDKRSYKF